MALSRLEHRRSALRATAYRGRRQPTRWPSALVWLPATLVGVAVLLPLVYLVLRALTLGDAAWAFLAGGRNVQILANSALLVVSVTGTSVLFGVPLAWLTARSDLPLRRFWSLVTVLPLVIPSYVAAYLFVLFLGEKGTLQRWLHSLFGVERLPGIYGFWGAWLVLTLLCFPYVVLSVRAALWRVDPALEESARALGHSQTKTFFRVTLPLLRPAILSGALLVALYVLSDFGAVSFLNYKTFTWAIYLQYGTINRALAAALSLVLVAFTVVLLLFERRARGHSTYYSSGTTNAPATRVPLGAWRGVALGFCALVALLSLLVPLGVLLQWFVKGVLAGETIQSLWGLTFNSLFVAGAAALVTVVAALPIATLSVRHPGWFSTALERATHIGFALPGIVVALSLVFFFARYARPLYQGFPVLIFAYVTLFLPVAVGAVRSALLQVNPNVEEAARGLGKSPLAVLRLVNLPLVRSGMGAGGAMVFLLTMKELPATLILGPTGFKTLATSVWTHINEAFFAQAAAPSLALVLASCGSLAFILGQKRRWER